MPLPTDQATIINSAADLLAYQIGWGNLLLGWDISETKGLQPLMPAPGYRWNQLGKLAQSFYNQYANLPIKELCKEFSKTLHNIVTWVNNQTPETLFHPGQRRWAGNKWPLVKWIQVNTIAPYQSARRTLRKANIVPPEP
ncbi:MAG TPA: ClbS/DfsB family four-helix bundle protein [Alphaproteobacteria bacterium]|nr:ClbS/DfsB family four-helix bundle protein [Alphaproteobacteria bacterium]